MGSRKPIALPQAFKSFGVVVARSEVPTSYYPPPTTKFWVILAWGSHPFPSRTRKLSLTAPMVLHARVCGRVGSCPD